MTCSATTFGLVDGRPVFMSLHDDSYFMLESEAEAAFLRAMSEPGGVDYPVPSDRPWPAEAQPIGPVACIRPSSSVLAGPQRHSGSILDAFQVWRLLLNARRSLQRSPVTEVLSGPSALGVAAPASRHNTPMLASRFATARRLVPISGNCLTDSLALIRWLLEHGAGATLIFGVKLDPFAAHCWVQADDILLNDLPERVDLFTPVRAIECSRPMP